MQKKQRTRLAATGRLAVASALLSGFSATVAQAQQIILEGFWWNYRNNNDPGSWANYVADLAPRLKALGINAVWLPPNLKTRKPTDLVYSNGYSPFDNYDLGDKYQHGQLRTKTGTKDELLRCVAILHANGIDVVQDIVLNHLDGAGSDDASTGGQDPAAQDDNVTNRMKNFRYVSYLTPASSETAANYLARNGRFPKNWQNFNPNPDPNSGNSGDWNATYFGPDISYYPKAFGPSSNATYNPAQYSDYMRTNTRAWLAWYKKQVGFDGVRLDAVKLFPDFASEDFLNNLQSNAGWASGGEAMFAVGEYAQATTAQMDQWVTNVKNRAGTFDFSLRGGLLSLINGNGAFNIGSLPDYQQGARTATTSSGKVVHRTVPFVNNHDTFRPTTDANGNYTGWDTGGELYPHIDPSDPRLPAAYAVALAVDGSPQIFFEDLFNLGTTGKRYTHNPRSATDLPVRDDLANLIWCHQNLHFKDGAYKVPYRANDYLIIERSGKALIGITDHWDTWQSQSVSCDFPAGTVLKDYSGATSDKVTVSASKTVAIKTPPCNGTAPGGRRGYSVWAPDTPITPFTLTGRATTQEWELADDLGDSDLRSLGQGGRLPAGSTAYRTAARIYVGASQPISYTLYPGDTTPRDLTVTVFSDAGTALGSTSGQGTLSGSYKPTPEGWYLLKVKNTTTANPAQGCYLKVTYTPPTAVTGSQASRIAAPLAAAGSAALAAATLQIFPNPAPAEVVALTIQVPVAQVVTVQLYDLTGRLMHAQPVQLAPGDNPLSLKVLQPLTAGLYQLRVPQLSLGQRVAIE